jgi:hypothetical protein
MQRMFVARLWAAGSGPMGCLDGDDVVRDVTIEEMSQEVSSASPLGGYIIRPTKLSSVAKYIRKRQTHLLAREDAT